MWTEVVLSEFKVGLLIRTLLEDRIVDIRAEIQIKFICWASSTFFGHD